MMFALLLAAPAEWPCLVTLKKRSTFIWKHCRGCIITNLVVLHPVEGYRLRYDIADYCGFLEAAISAKS